MCRRRAFNNRDRRPNVVLAVNSDLEEGFLEIRASRRGAIACRSMMFTLDSNSGHCFLFLCFSSPARIAFGGNSKKKKNRPLELSSEVRSEPNRIVHANNNIVSKRGLPFVCFKCGSASPLPVAEEVSSKFQSAHPVCQECFAKGVCVRTRGQKQMRT